MELLSLDGTIKVVTHTGGRSDAVAVYNFEVEGQHNYFVGSESILVHNPPPPPVYTDFNRATQEALLWLQANGVDTAKVSGLYNARLGPHAGSPIGVRFQGGGFCRIEWKPEVWRSHKRRRWQIERSAYPVRGNAKDCERADPAAISLLKELGVLEYIEQRLKPQIANGEVRLICDADQWFARIADAFPMGINRIAWEQVASRRHLAIFSEPRAISSDELEGRLETHRTAIEGWFAEISLDMDTEVIWLGDDSDCGLRMSLGVFLRHFPPLLSLPQHSYVVSDEGDWCLNYTMEGDLFFGTREGAKPD
jgi:hypothetical protein